jgi:hypothetical protein
LGDFSGGTVANTLLHAAKRNFIAIGVETNGASNGVFSFAFKQIHENEGKFWKQRSCISLN